MKIYTYGIIDSSNKIDNSINGLGSSSVYNIPYRDIGIVVSKLQKEVQNITQDQVVEHERVIEKLMDKFTVLPMRFFTVFNGEEDILFMMKDYYSDFTKNLDRLRSRVEFGIKVIWSGKAIKESIAAAYKKNAHNMRSLPYSAGKNYLKAKFEEYKIDKQFKQKADECISMIDKFFNGFIVERKLERLKTNNLLLNAAYLVKKEKQGDFKKAFEKLRNTHSDLKYLFSGPWPAYNFISLTKRDKVLQWAK